MGKTYEIRHLSAEFCNNHSVSEFPEMELKDNRPYLVCLLQIESNTFAIPFRTNMKHNYGYKFRNTDRETHSSTGLDFTKAIVITSPADLGNRANISNKEFLELSEKHFFIRNKFTVYVKNYYKFIQGRLPEILCGAYRYSTLKYFHKELGIE